MPRQPAPARNTQCYHFYTNWWLLHFTSAKSHALTSNNCDGLRDLTTAVYGALPLLRGKMQMATSFQKTISRLTPNVWAGCTFNVLLYFLAGLPIVS